MAFYLKEYDKFSHLVICLFDFKSKYNSEYRGLLNKFNVQIVEVGDEERCQFVLSSIKCNGILIDTSTYMKSSIHIKEFMSNIEAMYPTARIRYSVENHEMELIISNGLKQVSLQDFLENYCANFDAKILRKYKRVSLNLNLRLFYVYDGKLADFFCTSTDISETGLFVINGANHLPIRTKVIIQILELNKNGFLRGTVVRTLKWGEKLFHAPGIGVHIYRIDDEIYEDYIKLIKSH